jgi:hypothetical protein
MSILTFSTLGNRPGITALTWRSQILASSFGLFYISRTRPHTWKEAKRKGGSRNTYRAMRKLFRSSVFTQRTQRLLSGLRTSIAGERKPKTLAGILPLASIS